MGACEQESNSQPVPGSVLSIPKVLYLHARLGNYPDVEIKADRSQRYRTKNIAILTAYCIVVLRLYYFLSTFPISLRIFNWNRIFFVVDLLPGPLDGTTSNDFA